MPPQSPGPGAGSLLPGTLVGRYRVDAVLGRGGMGEVYRARDTLLRCDVALKRIFAEGRSGEEIRQHALHEARAAAALSHPGIAVIKDVLEHDAETFIVQELVEGTPLDRRGGMPEVAPLLDLLSECCEALSFAAERGIIHCDLKPANLMITPGGRVKILDFGISRRLPTTGDTDGSGELSLGLVGTPAYMAPEVLAGERPEAASDIFSLGVIAYELLTGTNPFRRADAMSTILAVVQSDPAPPGSIRAGVPAPVDALVLRMIAKQRASRFGDYAVLLAAIAETRARLAAGAGPAVVAPTETALHPAGSSREPYRNLLVTSFESRSDDAAVSYFAAGLTEAIEVRLAGIADLHVVDDRANPRLQLTGSVQREADRLRIRYRLVDREDGKTLGGDIVEGDAARIFELEDAVTDGVARVLAAECGFAPAARRAPRSTTDVTAYDLYLQARGYLSRFQEERNVEIAIDLFERALAGDPDFALALAGLGEAFWKRYEATHDTAWVREAERVSLRASVVGNDLAEAHVTLGTVYLGTGRVAEAEAEFRIATELDLRSDAAWRGLARAREMAGRVDDARDTYERAIRARPDYWAGHNELGGFFYRHGRYEEALAAFQRVVELTPDNARGYSNLGAMYQRLGRTDEAIEAYQRSIRIHPSIRALSNLANCYRALGRHAEAAGTYERALALDPSDFRVWGSLAGTYLLIPGRDADAKRSLREAAERGERSLEVNPADSMVAALVAQYYGELGDEGRARLLAERALAASPAAEALVHIAMALEGVGDRAAAIQCVRRALERGYPEKALREEPALAPVITDPAFAPARP